MIARGFLAGFLIFVIHVAVELLAGPLIPDSPAGALPWRLLSDLLVGVLLALVAARLRVPANRRSHALLFVYWSIAVVGTLVEAVFLRHRQHSGHADRIG